MIFFIYFRQVDSGPWLQEEDHGTEDDQVAVLSCLLVDHQEVQAAFQVDQAAFRVADHGCWVVLGQADHHLAPDSTVVKVQGLQAHHRVSEPYFDCASLLHQT